VASSDTELCGLMRKMDSGNAFWSPGASFPRGRVTAGHGLLAIDEMADRDYFGILYSRPLFPLDEG